MKKTSDLSKTGSKSDQVDKALRGWSSLLIISLLVLVALTIGFTCWYIDTGEYFSGLIAHLSGMLATGILIGLFVQLALSCRTKNTSPKVLAALLFRLEHDSDPGVRSHVAESLAELELEQSSDRRGPKKVDKVFF